MQKRILKNTGTWSNTTLVRGGYRHVAVITPLQAGLFSTKCRLHSDLTRPQIRTAVDRILFLSKFNDKQILSNIIPNCFLVLNCKKYRPCFFSDLKRPFVLSLFVFFRGFFQRPKKPENETKSHQNILPKKP